MAMTLVEAAKYSNETKFMPSLLLEINKTSAKLYNATNSVKDTDVNI